MSRFDFISGHSDTGRRKRTLILVLAFVALVLQAIIEFHLLPGLTPDSDLIANPAEVNQPSSYASSNGNAPASPSGQPGKVTPTPGKVQGTPGKVTPTPGKVQGTPGKVTPTPGKVQGTPGKVTPTPGKVQGTPGKVTPTPGKVQGTPGKVTPTPGKVQGTPGKVTPTPGKVQSTPGKVTPTPGKVQGIPGKVKGIPGKMKGIPGKVQGTPGKDNQTGRQTTPQEWLLGIKALSAPGCKCPLTAAQARNLKVALRELDKAYGQVRNSTRIIHDTLTPQQFQWLETHPDKVHSSDNAPPEQSANAPAQAALKVLNRR